MGSEPWYSWEIGRIYDTLSTGSDGLSSEDAATRLSEYGPKWLPSARPVSIGRIFLRQFTNPLIYVLGLAAIVSFAIGEVTDAGFIAAILVVNALVGGVQEWRAERSSQALQQLIRTRATVVRDGEARVIDGEDVVPGDVVLLDSGFRIPADVRLVSTHGLEIDESALTGESAPVLKDEAWDGDSRAPLGDRRNMAHAGTVVNRGRGRGVVVETGADTVVGRLAEDVTSVEGGQPPSRRAWNGSPAPSNSSFSSPRRSLRSSEFSSSSTTLSRCSSSLSHSRCQPSPKDFPSGSPSHWASPAVGWRRWVSSSAGWWQSRASAAAR